MDVEALDFVAAVLGEPVVVADVEADGPGDRARSRADIAVQSAVTVVVIVVRAVAAYLVPLEDLARAADRGDRGGVGGVVEDPVDDGRFVGVAGGEAEHFDVAEVAVCEREVLDVSVSIIAEEGPEEDEGDRVVSVNHAAWGTWATSRWTICRRRRGRRGRWR